MANIQEYRATSANPNYVSVFDDVRIFEQTLNMASVLAKSAFVPKAFQGSPESCLVAIDLSRRLGVSVLTIFPHLYVIDAKPAFSTQFLITLVNRSGLFSRVEWETGVDGEITVNYCDFKDGQRQTWSETVPNHYAIAKLTERRTNRLFESPCVDIRFADRNGWVSKPGSKWRTMPEIMCAYRSASILIKRICPELTMGMDFAEDVQDAIETIDIRQDVYLDEPPRAVKALPPAQKGASVDELSAALADAQTQEELDAVAAKIKDAGVSGADRQRLGKVYRQRKAELVPEPEPEPEETPEPDEEPEETPKQKRTTPKKKANTAFTSLQAAVQNAESHDALDSVRVAVEEATVRGDLSGVEFSQLGAAMKARANGLNARNEIPRESQLVNYQGMLDALSRAKTKEDLQMLLKACDSNVKRGYLTNAQGVDFYSECRKHEKKLLA